MKIINKLLIISALFLTVSCNDALDLDINTNPNAVSPDNAELAFLYNQVQLDFESFFSSTWYPGASASRMRAMTSFFYNEAYSSTTFDGIWTNAYADLIPDLNAVISTANEGGLTIHSGSAKIMKAYVLMTLVDLFGDVPYSESGQGTDIIAPNADDGASIYAAAEALLDEAVAELTGSTAAAPAFDGYYGGNADSWAKLANSMKIKLYLSSRLVDGSAGSKIAAIVAGGNFITDGADDFVAQYGTNRDNPNSRHPFYNNSYEGADGNYMSTYYMWLLDGAKSIEDPRLRLYFYRQDGNLTNEDPNIWDCVLTQTPFDLIPPGQFDHYLAVDPNLPFCITSEDGYYGRDHGNGQGIPPDGPVRTVYGLYPAGGSWDDNSFAFTQNDGTTGALGGGFAPIMLSSYVDFMRAEAALAASSGEDARALLESGVRKSIDKVLSFMDLVPASITGRVVGTDPVTMEPITAIQNYGVSTDDIEAYVAEVLATYDAAGDATAQLDVVMKEYYIALWGNGMEAYNMYRRTGMPLNMPPLIDPQAAVSSSFVRSHLFPAVYVNLNSNATQKNTDTQVFWDTNAAGFID